MIRQSMPLLKKDDFNYIRSILESGQIAKGRLTQTLESRFCRFTGLRHSFATTNGTAALHLGLLSLGISQGDEVIIPSYTCVALLNAVNYLAAIPVMADIDPETFNITPDTVKRKISRKTKAIIVTHTFGFPADTDGILKYGIPVIEDCAHSIGSFYKGSPTGTKGKIAVFSMYATKMLTSGEGGMVCTDSNNLAGKISDLSEPDRRKEYRLRYNYKMSDLSAGLGLSQLDKISIFAQRRISIAKQYRESFSSLPVRFQEALPDTEPNYYRFVILIPKAENVIRFTQKRKVICDRPIFKPLHEYLGSGRSGGYPGSGQVWKEAVSVPIYPALKEGQITEIIAVITAAFKHLKHRR